MNNPKRVLLTTYQIRRLYEDTHGGGRNNNLFDKGLIYKVLVDLDVLKAENFPIEDLLLSLDDFRKKQGWEWTLKKNLINKRMVKVQCIETGQIYESITFAAIFHQTTRSSISAVLSGKQKKAAGLTWEKLQNDHATP